MDNESNKVAEWRQLNILTYGQKAEALIFSYSFDKLT